MDIQPQTQQPISDDQELAKVLAGVTQQADDAASMQFEETPVTTPVVPAAEQPQPAPVAAPEEPAIEPATPVATEVNDSLDAIKKDALVELRPLVDKLDVSPEEKFDTYLLLLRSTDDQSLVGPAHEAARGIADEARRAQALLDIIKEIDYLSGANQPQA